MFRNTQQWAGYIAVGTLGALLLACGGGGSGASGCNALNGDRNPNLPACPVAPVAPPPPVPVGATLALALVDANGAASVALAPERPGTLLATLKDGNGVPVPNIAVSVTSNDKSAIFTPASGSALTNAGGVAGIGLPAGGQAGAFTAVASATVAGKVVTASTAYSVTLPTITLSAMAIAPASLAAGGTASLTVSALNGTQPFTPVLPISFSSPCVSAGKAKISSPVSTVNGVAQTSYTDMGCGAPDLVTASTVFNGASASSGATLNVLQASAGQLAFVSALPQNISLKGTGGAGRQENSVVTFKLLDRQGVPVANQTVNFALNTSAGGLTLNPVSAISAADGSVTTTVRAGTVNTPVRVTASLAGGAIASLSDQLVVSTGVPEQDSFSLSASVFNVEGWNGNGCPAPYGSVLTARLADHFHNPAPDGTAVSFTASGGSVDASCLTGLSNTTLTDGSVITQKGIPGQCSVRFCSGGAQPNNGRVSVLAYALGEESFTDLNSNNRYDAGEPFTDLGEPFRDDLENGILKSGAPYIDSNANATFDTSGDGKYNGVLQSVPNGAVNTVHIRKSLMLVLSGSNAAVSLLDGSSATGINLTHCVDNNAFNNATKTFTLAIRDNNQTVYSGNTLAGNILPAGTRISVSSSNGSILGGTNFVVPNTSSTSSANWLYPIQMVSDASQATPGGVCSNSITSGTLSVTVVTPDNVVTTARFSVDD